MGFKKMLAILFAAVMLAGCEDDEKVAQLPTFHGFTMTWENPTGADRPAVGDVVTFTAVQKSLGSYINTTKYRWSVTTVVDGQEQTYTPSSTTPIVYDRDKSNPSLRWIVPAGNNGQVTVNFSAEYSFSVDFKGQSVEPFVPHEPYRGNITAGSVSALFGNVSGSATFSIGH